MIVHTLSTQDSRLLPTWTPTDRENRAVLAYLSIYLSISLSLSLSLSILYIYIL